MSHAVLRTLLIAAASACIVAAGADAQATVQVEPDDPVHASVDRLIAEGAVRTAVVGQRPYARRELARLLAEARAHVDTLAARDTAAAARITALLDDLDGRYGAAAATATRPLDRLSAEGVLGGGRPRAIPFGGTGLGPLGSIDAVTQPLTERRLGRVYGDRATLALETGHRFQLGSHAAFALSTRAWTGRSRDEAPACAGCGETLRRARPVDGAALRTAALTLGTGNLRLSLGREHLLLGQGMAGGGLMLGDNAPALDMVRVASDAPFRLPWVLRRLGPMQATAFVADLGGDRAVPHAKLAGWKLSVLLSPTVEWGVSVLSQQGGEGAPGARAAERVIDLLPLIDVLLLQDRDLQFSNKLAGVDVRVRVPRARGLELYWEGAADDFDIRRIGSSLTEDAAHVAGAALTRLTGDARHRLDLEVRRTGLRMYQHEQFGSGLTLDRFVLGDPLGPRGAALSARLARDFGGRSRGWESGARERRSDDRYVGAAEEGTAADWAFVKVEDRPEEVRHRVVLTWMPRLGRVAVRGRLDAGWERVRRFAFADGAATHGLLRLGVDARF